MKLYQFQTNYLKNLPNKFIFSADTGTGKTMMALAHYRKQVWDRVASWEGRGFETKFPPKPLQLLILGPAAKMRTLDWQVHVEEMWPDENNRPDVTYLSYEKFSRNPTVKEYKKNGNRGIWREWAGKSGFAVICDECHRAANPQSGIGKAVNEIAQRSAFFVGLSATPLPNGWISAANYFKIFGFVKNLTAFKARYCNVQTYKGFPEIVGYYHEDEIKRLWNGISKPLKKDDAIELPPVVTVPVSFAGNSGYVKILKERMFGDKLLDNPSAYAHALRQSTHENKLPWLDEFIEGTSSNVVIFYNYVSERQAILDMLKKKHRNRAVFRQDGEMHQVPPKHVWDGLRRTVTLAQYQSGSTAVEMTYADTIIYFSPTYSYSTYHQSIGRIERIGQKNKMTIFKLCVPSSIERDIWIALRNKVDFSDKIWYNTIEHK